ncbi:hypothetical protein WL30_19935 [Burkholderia ubonensis]|nr:hypothetical protein WL30_19935 [Burkholderia ubonensis]KWB21244.1 hypothetical protein WL31_05250 [Burkholderia ubonensis]
MSRSGCCAGLEPRVLREHRAAGLVVHLDLERVARLQRFGALRGRPVKLVAAEVGYGSAGALARAFAQGVGLTPTQWLAQQRG